MGKSPPASFRKWRNYRPLEYSALEHCAGWKRFGRFPVSAYQQLGTQAETQYMVMAMFHSEGVYRIGGGVSVPRLLMTQPPEYTAGARAARIEGQVDLTITVGEDGVPRDLRIEKPLGYGLDEKAIECVGKWRFSPGLKNGEAVPVAASISVGFSLERGEQDPRAHMVKDSLTSYLMANPVYTEVEKKASMCAGPIIALLS